MHHHVRIIRSQLYRRALTTRPPVPYRWLNNTTATLSGLPCHHDIRSSVTPIYLTGQAFSRAHSTTTMTDSPASSDHHSFVTPAVVEDIDAVGVTLRLPSHIQPIHYNLRLTPNLQTFIFNAEVDIDIEINETCSEIQLNAAELQIITASITQGISSQNAAISYNETDELVILTVPETLSIGLAEINIIYTGSHNDKMRGCYRSKYTVDGADKFMAVTQFEAADARRALPCFDDPASKASFTVSLTVDPKLQAVSNMPIIKTVHHNDGTVTHTFDKTPRMSTYLLAWCVGEFDVIEATTSDGIVIRCFTPLHKGEQGRFALDCAVKILPFYNKFFNHTYPLPKLDMLAIADFAAGAMENWGCVTYRSTALLIDEDNSSSQTRQWVAMCVTHELSHQWFGNLVTMEWWTHLWLNEGFATWCENYATDVLYPSWSLWDQFVYSDVNSALSLDALKSSHPIEVEVHRAEEVDEIFDAISYSKGSVVVRMIEDLLGIETFKRGIQEYIKTYEYKNAETNDLWRCLEQTSNQPIQEMMERWTQLVGFPLLTLSEGIMNKDGTISYHVIQQRFLVNGIDTACDSIWYVPISFLVSGHNRALSKQILQHRQDTLILDAPNNNTPYKWVKINAFQTGCYRVLYPTSMLSALRSAIVDHDPNLTATDRLGLQNDLFALARAGVVKTTSVLQFISAYEDEESYVVWADLLGNLAELADILKHTEHYELYSSFVLKLLSKIIDKIGWKKQADDSHLTSLLRTRVLGAAAKYGHPATIIEAQNRFTAYLKLLEQKPSTSDIQQQIKEILPPDLRSVVYSQIVKHGGIEGYETMIHLATQTDLQEEKVRCIMSLAAAKDKSLLSRGLDYAMSESVRSQDAPSLISAIGGNRYGTHIAWTYLKDHWDMILQRFGGTSSLGRIIDLVSNFSDSNIGDDVEDFFKTHSAPSAQQAIKQAVETLRSNAAYLSREGEEIAAFLQQQQ